MSDSTGSITLDEGAVKAIRCALLDGLLCYGEYDRLQNAADVLKGSSTLVPDFALPRHPTGDAETVKKIADALYYLERSES